MCLCGFPTLTNKVLNYTSLTDSNPKPTPATTAPLGSDKSGLPFAEPWGYAAMFKRLLYLSSNTRSDIQVVVHQVACFSHSPNSPSSPMVRLSTGLFAI